MSTGISHDTLRAKFSRWTSPGTGWCGRCGMSWDAVDSHSTQYTDCAGCFPLCGVCWSALRMPDRRLPYYRELWQQWWDEDVLYRIAHPEHPPGSNGQSFEALWADIERAVLAGK